MVDDRFSHFKPGDKVRLSFTGTVSEKGYDPNDGSVNLTDYGWLFIDDFNGLTAEVIEPEYEGGEVYIDADGVNFLRVGDFWYRFASEKVVAHGYPRRPLVKLVPETGV